MYTIRLFIWGYQQHFRLKAARFAREYFDILNKGLSPNIFIIGIREDDSQDRYPVCVEPEDCGYDPDDFLGVKEVAGQSAAEMKGRIIYDHPIAARKAHEDTDRRELQRAILAIVKQYDTSRAVTSFCSVPVKVERYHVSVVLQLNREAFESNERDYALRNNNPEGGNKYYRSSFLEAAINDCLDVFSEWLRAEDPGSSWDRFSRNPEDIIRGAGRTFIDNLGVAGKQWQYGGYLFEACDLISSMRYEKREGAGQLLIAKRGHPSVQQLVTLKSEVPLDQRRAVRKTLEMSNGELYLLTDGVSIYGLGGIINGYDKTDEDLFCVKFISYLDWKLLHADKELMRVTNGHPRLPTKPIDEEEFKTTLLQVFQGAGQVNSEELFRIAMAAAKQSHGTIILISEDPRGESNRLANQSTIIEPVRLDDKLILSLTAIDGALLVDLEGTCHAAGVILDGRASEKGTPSRGARYNSAVRYVNDSAIPSLAIVISEDGAIDLVHR